MKTILITGCAGMIGSNLAHYLLENTSYRILGLDDFSGGYVENLPTEGERFRMYSGSICDARILRHIFSLKKVDIVYHCAAYAAEGLSPFIRRFNYTNNLVGTANIVNCCIEYNVERLVFFSSIAVYGNGRLMGAGLPFKEDLIPNPIDPYGIAKYACEMDIQIAGEQHGLDWVIVRPFNVYGERQNIWDKYRNVLGIWIYNYMNNRPIQIYGDGGQTRNFTYVQDILPALRTLGEDPKYSKQIMNLGSDLTYTLNGAASTFRELIGPIEIEHLPARHEVKIARASTDKCKYLMPIPHTLSHGLKNMWGWVQKQPKRERGHDMPCEVTKGLYEHWKTK